MILAQADPATVKTVVEAADFLSGKDLKWYLGFFAVVGVSAALYIFRMLLSREARNAEAQALQASKYVTSMETQLTEQRASNAALHKQLMEYIVTDHAKSIEALNTFSVSVKELAQAVRELKLTRS